MTLAIAVLIANLSASAAGGGTIATTAADTCTYDTGSQMALLDSMARAAPGASLDSGRMAVTWSEGEETQFEREYGGCHHLLDRVSIVMPGVAAIPETVLFRHARELSRRFWGEHESSELYAALLRGDAVNEVLGDSSCYDLPDDLYDRVYVCREALPSRTRITVGRVRTF